MRECGACYTCAVSCPGCVTLAAPWGASYPTEGHLRGKNIDVTLGHMPNMLNMPLVRMGSSSTTSRTLTPSPSQDGVIQYDEFVPVTLTQ